MSSLTEFGNESLAAWKDNAQFWDDTMGEHGNRFWQRLEEPSLRRLLGPHLRRPHCRALDLATGNGLCARWLARHGATVTATDGVSEMLETTKKYTNDGDDQVLGPGIRFGKLDVTNAEDFAPFVDEAAKHGGYDIVLMNMAVMVVSTLDHLADALPKLLSDDGVFVAMTLHPVLFTSTSSHNVNVSFGPQTGEHQVKRSKVIAEYLHVPPARGVAYLGQKTKQVYFHRPMHELLGIFFKRGLVLDALEEPGFTEEDAVPDRLEAVENFVQLPVLMALRFRKGLSV